MFCIKTYDNGFRVISYYRNEPLDTYFHGKKTDRIYISNVSYNNEPCNIEKENYYIYLEIHRDFGDYKFYFNKNGKTVPTNETLQLIKENEK